MSEKLIIYHGGCRDGFCAAWVLHRRFPRAEFVEGFYGQDPPDVTDRDVIMVDFSYPRETLEAMADKCKRLLILDHHKTAQEALESFKHDRVEVVFDMNRSGAGLAYDFFYTDNKGPFGPRLWPVDYVEDRDLWRHSLPDTRRVSAFLGTVEFSFEAWDALDLSTRGLQAAIESGKAIEAKVRQYIRETAKLARHVEWKGYQVAVVSAPPTDVSELLHYLLTVTGSDISIGWCQRADGVYQYGLRSKGALDVSAIAKEMGGGGHRNAAGFQVASMVAELHGGAK